MSTTTRLVLGAVAAGAALLTMLAGACARDSPEARIRRTLDEAVAALAAKDVSGAGAALDDAYADAGKRSKKDLVRLAFFALQRGPVFVRLQSVDTEVKGETASTHLEVLAVQGAPEVKSAADLLATNARTLELTLSWKKHGADWRVTRIDGLPSMSFE